MAAREILRTKRLWMRDATPADIPAVEVFSKDFDVIRNTGSWPWPPDPDFTAARCQPIPPDKGLGGIVMRDDTVIGMASIFGEGELGYMFARDHWGQGYATEICRGLIEKAFATGQWPVLQACVFDDNPGSAKVLTKLGFVEGAACSGLCTSRGQKLPTRNFTLAAPQT